MIATKTYRRFAGSVALAAISGSLAVGAQAADRPAASRDTAQALSALTIRSQEMNRRHAADGGGAFIPGVTDFPARPAYTADGAGAFIPGVTDFPARPAYVEPSWTPPTTIEHVIVDSFQWADAGIGAGLATSAFLLAAGALLVLKRRRLLETLGA